MNVLPSQKHIILISTESLRKTMTKEELEKLVKELLGGGKSQQIIKLLKYSKQWKPHNLIS